MKNIFRNWDFGRWFRFLTGTGFAIFGFATGDHYVAFLGGVLVLLAILNWSCCCAGGNCNTGNDQKSIYKDFIKPYKADNA